MKMKFVHRPECTQTLEAVERGEAIVHIGGSPGIGKSATLEWLKNTINESHSIRLLQVYLTHDIESLIREIHHEIYESLPVRQRVKYRINDVSGLWMSSFGIEFDIDSDDINDLETVGSLIPDDKNLVICIDDIHKIDAKKQEIKELLKWLANTLPENIQLVSAGRIIFKQGIKTEIEIQPLSKEGVKELLQGADGFDESTAQRLHEQIGGNPYYFALLSESGQQITANDEILNFPEVKFQRYIEENYLQSLNTDEERFLRQTLPLVELDEHICSLAVPNLTRTEARRLLSSLRGRCIIEDSGYDDRSIRRYRLHDKFREFLCDLEQTDRTVKQLLKRFREAPVEARQRITEALAEIASDDPTRLEDYIDQVVQLLNDDDPQVRRNASVIVARLSVEYPAKIDSIALSTAIEFLESEDIELRQTASQQLANLAKSNPQLLEPHIDHLQSIIERQEEFPLYTPIIVGQLAEEYPEQMRPIVLQLKATVNESSQTLNYIFSDSFRKLNERYDQIEFRPQILSPDNNINELGTSPSKSRPSSDPIADSVQLTDTSPKSTFEYPQDTEITFTDEAEYLHRSQYAEVLKVWYHTDGETRPAVLKQLLTNKEGFTRQFESEVNFWGKIDDHDNVVTLLDGGTQPKKWFLMEYLNGGSLTDRIDRVERQSREEIDISLANRVLDGICDAISYAHNHDIVHGDITPSNVLFGSENGWSPRVGDWGQAQQITGVSEATMIYSATAPTVEGVTLPYAAPEMADPKTFGEIDKRTDVYQIAMIAYELYTGQRPFTASSPAMLIQDHLEEQPPLPSEVCQNLPSELDAVFETAFSKEKFDRYDSVDKFRTALLE